MEVQLQLEEIPNSNITKQNSFKINQFQTMVLRQHLSHLLEGYLTIILSYDN